MIKNLILDYLSTQERIVTNRETWHKSIKPLVKSTLLYYVQQYPSMDWMVEENNALEQGEILTLMMKTRNSGMKDKIQMKNISRIGGSLSFHQLFNGEIQVLVRYPQIEGIYKKEPDFKLLDIAAPEELDAAIVEAYIERFLQEIIDFERVERKTIGF